MRQKKLRKQKKNPLKKIVGIHGFRHSLVTHLLKKSIDIKYIRYLLGHSDIRTTDMYLHANKETP